MAEPFLGEIKIVAFNFAPRGWAFCDGQILPINQNQSLYSLLGTMYGGDGRTTFALPDLRGRSPIHVGAADGGTNRALGSKAGEETHTLTGAETPAHTHPLNGTNDLATLNTPGGNVPARGGSNFYGDIPPATAMDAAAVSSTGGGQGHENMMPFLVLNFVIALQGIFPPRN